MKQIAFVGLVLILFTAAFVSGQSASSPNTFNLDKPENMPKAKIGDVAWLAGEWKVEGLGGTRDEYYTQPQAGNMTGLFRLIKDNKTVFFEIVIIQEEQGSLVMKLKHFDPKLIGWEEREKTVDFPLVRLTESEINFAGITFRK